MSVCLSSYRTTLDNTSSQITVDAEEEIKDRSREPVWLFENVENIEVLSSILRFMTRITSITAPSGVT